MNMLAAAFVFVLLASPMLSSSEELANKAPVPLCGPYETACKFFCCPYASASCCWDGMGCCPNGKTCIGIFGVGVCVGFGAEKSGKAKVLAEIPAGPKYDRNSRMDGNTPLRVCPDGAHSCPTDKDCCTSTDGTWSCCPKQR
ncbi:progranulin-like isoform X2 [Uloborus diversus]|uniref:progranulin-like isoform X2 n=1 Tax=Uloborus diversus TaxID=327109 RepID=UPI0024093D2F|nr:progranulin-like isoform X2 [Uloborus diversus]